MKIAVFDAGPLISLALSGMLGVLKKLKCKGVEFVITPQVKREVIDKARNIKKYKLKALILSELIEEGIFKNSSIFVADEDILKETNDILAISKKVISASHEKISLIEEGEASCLAFSKLCQKENLIVIDERTTRLISESAENLKSLMENKLHRKLTLNKKELAHFKEFKYIRSSELIFLAYKRGLIDLKKDVETLDALLYSLKFCGTAISSKEIEEMKKMV